MRKEEMAVVTLFAAMTLGVGVNVQQLHAEETREAIQETPVVNQQETAKQSFKKGWVNENGVTRFYDAYGHYVVWEQKIDGKDYYFLKDGSMYRGLLTYANGNQFYYGKDGAKVKNELITTGGNTYYFGKNGLPLHWEQKIDGKEYYFLGNGTAYKGLLTYANGDKYYYGSDGTKVRNELITVGDAIYYFGSDGTPVHWEKTIDGKDYYFLGNGTAYKGVLTYANGDKYYYDHNGTKVRNKLINEKGTIYYFGANGLPIHWEQTIQGNEYYFLGNGTAYQGVLTYGDGRQYYFKKDGTKAKAGRIKENGKTYLITQDQTLYHGWLEEGKNRYYFRLSDGLMLTGNQKVDRRNYVFASDGNVIGMSAPIPYYNQTDARWAGKRYGQGDIASTGCVQTCASMIFSFLRNQTILPTDIASWAYQNNFYNGYRDGKYIPGTIGSFWPAAAKRYGFTCKGDLNVDKAIDELRHGRVIVAGVNPGHFTNRGSHAIVLYGIDEHNMVSVYDPYTKSNNKKWSITQILNEKSTDPDDTMAGGPIFSIG